MIIKTLEPVNVILANIYLVMLVQLAFNWNNTDCSTNSNIFQIAFLLTLVLRLLLQEGYLNKIISHKTYTALMLIFSGLFLTGLCVYESIIISQNWQKFNYDAKSGIGNLTCYQNRIVFVAEIIIGFLAVAKDVALIILDNEKPDLTV
jgi:hypothetical protein